MHHASQKYLEERRDKVDVYLSPEVSGKVANKNVNQWCCFRICLIYFFECLCVDNVKTDKINTLGKGSDFFIIIFIFGEEGLDIQVL